MDIETCSRITSKKEQRAIPQSQESIEVRITTNFNFFVLHNKEMLNEFDITVVE